jgi:hypothetical protein
VNIDLGTQSLIAGAVFDFAAHLTTLPKTVRVGGAEPVYDVLAELERWAFQRNLVLDDADVQGWDKTASSPTLEALARSGDTNRRRIGGALRSFAKFAVNSNSTDFENLIVRWASSYKLAIHDPQRAWAAHWWA